MTFINLLKISVLHLEVKALYLRVNTVAFQLAYPLPASGTTRS
jgi:hypothetical protein